jgi:hypothetical protein
MKRFVKIAGLLLLIAILFAGGRGYGQKVSGNISGLVTDPSGMAVPGAEVTVLKEGTGVAAKYYDDIRRLVCGYRPHPRHLYRYG